MRERLIRLEQEFATFRQQVQAGGDEASKIIERINAGDMPGAIDIYQTAHHASMGEAQRHVMEIRKRIGR